MTGSIKSPALENAPLSFPARCLEFAWDNDNDSIFTPMEKHIH
jgi:hypothetical protein